jgi:hypothetical protein
MLKSSADSIRNNSNQDFRFQEVLSEIIARLPTPHFDILNCG